MTEQEWMTGTDPTPLIEFIRGKVSERKLRLLGVACCRRITHLLERDCEPKDRQAGLQAIGVAEKYADGHATGVELSDAGWTAEFCLRYGDLQPIHWLSYSRIDDLYDIALAVVEVLMASEQARLTTPDADPAHPLSDIASAEWDQIRISELLAQAQLVRDIFGNPFRPLIAETAWKTSTVLSLAEAIYADRAFDRMPILADALEEAGCDNADILTHCRGEGPHVRGCWVVDLILGKQ